MVEKLTKANLKQIIFKAFKDVPKGNGHGVRYCTALDGHGDASGKDIEEHWWEYPDELKDNRFVNPLYFDNTDGIRFHLPALMTAAVDEAPGGYSLNVSVYGILCEKKLGERVPHQGHRQYLDYLKSIDISQIISHYSFTNDQVHAIALYLHWDTQPLFDYAYPLNDREAMISWVKTEHERSVSLVPKSSYNLTLEEAIAIEDEKYRILSDWFKAGNVNANAISFDEKT